ncbi:MAG: RsmF rRNA methyltransferase first C-terminal domain-containing protein [Lachnospiraceae bacterium]|nr:RsmF rRNA methyltransferase first C-terminal domain-containing protein [Lachnospiraceae bacterium]
MNLPQDFTKRMQDLLGAEYDDFIKSYERDSFGGLRANTLKIKYEDFKRLMPFTLTPVPWCKTGFYYEKDERPGKHAYHEMGLYYMQEPSAMSVAELADVQPGEKVLDLCAAPGGKSTQLAAAMQGNGLLVSNEIHPARCKILSQNIERMGIRNAVVTNETPQGLAIHFMNFFDCIVVDAPCSGEGMFRKEDEAVKQWSLDNVKMCGERQDEILDEAVKMLRSGGRIVYSTCTFAPTEDEECVHRFLERHPDFEVVKGMDFDGFAPGKPEWGADDERVKDTHRLWPHKIKGEGHFAALLVHTGEELPTLDFTGKKKKAVKILDKEKERLYADFIKDTLQEEPAGEKVLFGDALYVMPMEMSLKGLKVLRPGLHLGTFEKKRFEPSHSLALALKPEDVKNTFALSATEEEAGRYLRGESFVTEQGKGWTLVCIDGYSAGWGKVSNGMLKNHYPKGLRK